MLIWLKEVFIIIVKDQKKVQKQIMQDYMQLPACFSKAASDFPDKELSSVIKMNDYTLIILSGYLRKTALCENNNSR